MLAELPLFSDLARASERVRHGLWRCRRCSRGQCQAAGRGRRLEGRRGRCARRRVAAAQDGMGQRRAQAGQACEQAHGAAAPVRLVPHVLPPARLGHLPPLGGGPLARRLRSGGERVLCEQVRCLQWCPMWHQPACGRSPPSPTSPAVLRSIAPDRGIDNISPFYFTVMGTCLSFVLVFKSNIAYNRHAHRPGSHTHTLDSQTHGSNTHPRFAEPHSATHTPQPCRAQSARRSRVCAAPPWTPAAHTRAPCPGTAFGRPRGER